ncbi:nitrogen permease regulator of amino acid transport activity 3-domain-containing protein [Polychytrium aggregatum]|uniref:nitrogen permease regulator of amino acid transport activity 3-domain-containing protein n=1 Tax=Polychytrium aggregatum TaxID=110093 RepID=UPI0022FE96EB|nr:nitrogen permease regulator of amino acid transport activity 3-domain-containing protein [Polychytrium aggregatum]KAI9208839.1 nitrogen permease regulator of amino acid transport activity 3-domain-containing protein [Polychytrium aggregatum]
MVQSLLPILGILLICPSSTGPQFVFSYPADKVRYRYEILKSESDSDAGTRKQASSSSSNAPQKLVEEFLGFETSVLSDLLIPNASTLCDKMFRLAIDEVTFVGHPTLLRADRPGTGHRFARLIQRMSAHSDDDDTSKDMGAEKESHWESDHQGSHQDSKSATTGSAHPGQSDQSLLSMFNLVVAMQPTGTKPFSDEVKEVYVNVISKITAGLKYEQLKRGYIDQQCDVITRLKEQLKPRHHPEERAPAEVIDKILAESSLARLMANIYTSINSHSTISWVVNHSLDASLHLPRWKTVNTTSKPLSFAGDYENSREPQLLLSQSGAFGEVFHEEIYPVLRPYKTLLLLCDKEDLLNQLPLDSSYMFVELIQNADPTVCFKDMAALLDCSLPQLYRLVAHLVYWNKARIIHTIHSKGIYAIAPGMDLSALRELSADFTSRFHKDDLVRIVTEITISSPVGAGFLSSKSKNEKSLYLKIIAYLLRHDIIVQLYHYLFSAANFDVLEPPSISSTPEQANQPGEPPRASDEARSTELEFRERLIKYANGQFHLDEIAFLEKVGIKRIMTTVANVNGLMLVLLGESA